MNQPYPRLPDFNYHKPKSIKEAVSVLEIFPEQSRLYTGGTDCFVQIRDRRYLPEHMIDLKSIPELQGMHFDNKSGLKIGAAVNMNTLISDAKVVKHYPVLINAAKEVAGYQLRTRATVVGNICNASPCGDTIGPCLVYNGQIHLVSSSGERIVPLKDFFTGPGKTVLKRGEIATAISLPKPEKGTQGTYKSIGRNKMGDLAIAAVTVLGYPNVESKSGYKFRIALTAVAPTVVFVENAEALLRDETLSRVVIEKASKLSAQDSKPINDIRASAEYRKDMIQTLTYRGLIETCEQLGISF